MLIVVGLGNPGARFTASRHNIGFRFIDLLAKKNEIRLNDRRLKAVLGQGHIHGHEVVLAKPRTFMNNSGEGIEYLLSRFGGRPSDLLVVYDEMALPTGRIRLRPQGSHAGHNGIRSIISSVQTEEFPRLRIGVGQPDHGRSSIPHVLGKFSKEEEHLVAQSVQDAVGAVQCMIEENIDIAMNRYNVVGNHQEN
ncbi:aminoacyl-tRNA hydrolase [SAR202 cluster bacterium AD-802-F09_MRT_200m]|nr:aminoacyl-tRNA hydrolase [SAR202 cluster bacterium AD-802-F09_MRT_200m]